MPIRSDVDLSRALFDLDASASTIQSDDSVNIPAGLKLIPGTEGDIASGHLMGLPGTVV